MDPPGDSSRRVSRGDRWKRVRRAADGDGDERVVVVGGIQDWRIGSGRRRGRSTEKRLACGTRGSRTGFGWPRARHVLVLESRAETCPN